MRQNKSYSGLTAMLLLVLALLATLPAAAQQPGIQNFQKMKYGFFVHYVWGATAYAATRNADGSLPAGLDDLANRFDAAAFANDLSSMGVEYLIFTAWHANMNCLWPSPAMDRWLSGHTSQRDLLRDVLDAVRAKGIKVLFYTHPRDGHDLTTAEQAATGWGPTFDYARWNNFINDLYADLISRYGSDIEGVYIDQGGNNGAYVDYTRLRNTIKAANTNLLMLQNYYGTIYTCDLGDKEVNSFGTPDPNAWPAPSMPSAVVMGSTWWASKTLGQYAAKYSPEAIFRYTVLKAGITGSAGGTSWAAGPYAGGGWETGVLTTMRAVAAYLAPIARSITNTYASTAYVTPSDTTLASLPWGVATRSIDDRYEYIHVLNPPAGNTLLLPPPADRKVFAAARLLGNGQALALKQDNSGVSLSLQGTNTWNNLDTAIELTVAGVRPFSNSTFFDDFSNGANRWLLSGGNWSVEAGQLSQTNTAAFGYNAAVTLDRWADAAFEFDFRILDNGGNATDWAGCNLRKTNPADTHTASGYLLYFRANGQVCLYKAPADLASVNTGLAFTNLTHVRVVTDGPNIQVYLTNAATPLLNVSDSSYPGPGFFSLTTGKTHSHFANVVITPIYGFETPVISGSQYAPTGSVWTFTGPGGLASNGSGLTGGNPAAPEGNQVAFLQGTAACSNTLSCDPGQYRVLFAAAQRANLPQPGQTLELLLDGATLASFSPPASATNYQDYLTPWFSLPGGDHCLAFVGSNTRGGDNTILLDNVRLAFSPLPPGPVRTWGGGEGAWDDPNWFPGPVRGPAESTNVAVINSGTVSVNAPLPPLAVVTLNGGILSINQTLADNPGNYNWYGNVQQTTLYPGSKLTLNSSSHLHHLTLAGGELASTGVDPFHGYGGWHLDDLTLVTGGFPSCISAQQLVLEQAGFQVDTGSVLNVTACLAGTNGLALSGGGVLVIATNQAWTGPLTLHASTLRLANFTPIPGASRWFDASALNLDAGSNVSSWPDLSGHNAPASALGGNNATPAFVADAGTGTGLGALHFGPGTGPNPATNSQALGFPADASLRAVFSVFKGASFLLTDSATYHFHRPTDTDPTSPLWSTSFASGNLRYGSTYVNGLLVNGSTYLMPTNLHNGFNLVEVLATNSVTASSFNKDRVYHAGDQYQAEVLLYDFALTEAQRLQNEAYLQAKWFGLGARNNLLPSGTTVNFSGGATLDLGGIPQTLAGLSSSDRSGNRVVLGAATLTVSNSADCAFDGTLSGRGGLLKQGNGTLALNGLNTFTGPTRLGGGRLLLNGTLADGPLTVGAGATLGGTGLLAGAVTVQAGGTLCLGPAGGVLTLTNRLAFAPESFAVAELNASGACGRVAGLANVAYAGTLILTNASGPLTATNQFALFGAASSSGNFAALRGSPGPGLAYSFNPTNGLLSVVAATAASPTPLTCSLSGNSLTLSWPADHLGWILQSQTNALAVGLGTNWLDLPATSAATQAVLRLDPADQTVFFRLRHP